MKYIEKTFRTNGAAETEQCGFDFAGTLKKGDVVALCGALGAGKTTFVRGIAKRLAPECVPLVHSPTFTIVNEYRGKEISIFHFDFYRLKNGDDLYSCGFDDYFDEKGMIIAEWADMFLPMLPPETVIVKIEKDAEEERTITISVPEP